MMHCSKCGLQLDASSRFCSGCGTPTGPATAPTIPASAGIPAQGQVIVVHSGKSAGLAAVLSFFWCGLGQIYNGQIGKGLLFGFLYLVSLILIFAIVGIITTPLLWIWGMIDAYQTSERLNREGNLAG
jgi:TM2 domain-containing membrane protein YozV